MAFYLSTWQQQAKKKLRETGRWLKRRTEQDAPYFTYGALRTVSLWPLVEAARGGELYPAIGALYGVATGDGTKLIAEQIQRWKDGAGKVTEADVARWVAETAQADPLIRDALDTILLQLQAVSKAAEAMDQAAREAFMALLRQDLKQLGNQRKFKAELTGSGAVAQGERSQAVGKRGVAARKGIRKSTVVTGDRNVVQRGKTNVKSRKISKSAIGDHAKVVIHEAPSDDTKPIPKTLRETYLEAADRPRSRRCG